MKRMKSLDGLVFGCVLGCLLAMSSSGSAMGRHECRVSKAVSPVRALTVVIPSESRLLRFAGEELSRFLEEATGLRVPLASQVSPAGLSLVLGDHALSRQAGLDLSAIPAEGYAIRRRGDVIYLAGHDSPDKFPGQNRWGEYYDRGTLSAVYDFLERFVGIRFYFPGKFGTIVPRVSSLALPQEIDIVESPDFSERRFSHMSGAWYESPSTYAGVKGRNLNLLRLRTCHQAVPYGHGLAYLKYVERLKDHPEYFALRTDGSRYNDPTMSHTGHFCFHSGIREQIYQDAKRYFSGEKPPQGMTWWDVNVTMGPYFGVMPQDWLYWCACDTCRKIARPGRQYDSWTPEERQGMSDVIWGLTAELARRLAQDGFPAIVTQMAYDPYDRVPRCTLPQNIRVQLGIGGPWGRDQAESDRKIAAWNRKLGRKVTLWTYANKFGSREYPGIPSMTPQATGRYFQDRRNQIAGSFMESETDQYIFHYLNYYVFAKVGWNTSTDLKALLDEHYRLMFGAGAPMMKAFYEQLERLWLDGVVGHVVNTGLGPQSKLPTNHELWTKIYSEEALKEMVELFERGERAAAHDQACLGRIRFMRRQLLEPLLQRREQFKKDQQAIDDWCMHVPGVVGLRPSRGDVNEVYTKVDVREDSEHFVFRYTCQEPEMARLKVTQREADSPDLWSDSCVELFLNPSGDRKTYYHWIVNALGTMYDSRCQVNEKEDVAWTSGARVQVFRDPASWSAELYVPKSCLGHYVRRGFPVNFARHRVLTGQPPRLATYQWTPVPNPSFHSLQQYGVMLLGPLAHRNLVSDGDFDCLRKSYYRLGEWFAWHSGKRGGGQYVAADDLIFMTSGKSLRLHNTPGGKVNVVQHLPKLESHSTYRLSYFIRTQELVGTGNQGAGAYLSLDQTLQFAFPRTTITGTTPWHRLVFEFTTGELKKNHKTILGLWIWGAGGDAWFDHVKLEKVR